MTINLQPKTKTYSFVARISNSQLKKLNALIYTSEASHADFLNGVLNIFHMLCENGQDEILRKLFGNEFYVRFFQNYLDNLYQIEQREQGKKLKAGSHEAISPEGIING